MQLPSIQPDLGGAAALRAQMANEGGGLSGVLGGLAQGIERKRTRQDEKDRYLGEGDYAGQEEKKLAREYTARKNQLDRAIADGLATGALDEKVANEMRANFVMELGNVMQKRALEANIAQSEAATAHSKGSEARAAEAAPREAARDQAAIDFTKQQGASLAASDSRAERLVQPQLEQLSQQIQAGKLNLDVARKQLAERDEDRTMQRDEMAARLADLKAVTASRAAGDRTETAKARIAVGQQKLQTFERRWQVAAEQLDAANKALSNYLEKVPKPDASAVAVLETRIASAQREYNDKLDRLEEATVAAEAAANRMLTEGGTASPAASADKPDAGPDISTLTGMGGGGGKGPPPAAATGDRSMAAAEEAMQRPGSPAAPTGREDWSPTNDTMLTRAVKKEKQAAEETESAKWRPAGIKARLNEITEGKLHLKRGGAKDVIEYLDDPRVKAAAEKDKSIQFLRSAITKTLLDKGLYR